MPDYASYPSNKCVMIMHTVPYIGCHGKRTKKTGAGGSGRGDGALECADRTRPFGMGEAAARRILGDGTTVAEGREKRCGSGPGVKCSNCGKDAPYGGNVCPFCGVDKDHDKSVHDMKNLVGCIGFPLTVWIVTSLSNNLLNGLIAGVVVYFIGQVVVMFLMPAPEKRIAPTIQRSKEVSTTDGEPTKPCPFCAETIKAAAVKCRFCGSDLNR